MAERGVHAYRLARWSQGLHGRGLVDLIRIESLGPDHSGPAEDTDSISHGRLLPHRFH